MNLPEQNSTLFPSIKSLADFIGQESLRVDLLHHIHHAKVNRIPLPHFIFTGPNDAGKRTLACALANEMLVKIKIAEAYTIQRQGDIGAILTNLRQGDILIIENIEQIKPVVFDSLITAMGDFSLDIVIGKGVTERSVRLKLPHFTIIGTTSKPTQVDKRFLKWVIPLDFVPYSLEEIEELIILIGEQLKLYISPDAALLLAPYCEGNPGYIRVLLTRILRYYNVESGELSSQTAQEVLERFGFKPHGSNSYTLIERLQNMGGVEFENFVADFFRRKGYKIETTPITGDHGIDLVAKRNEEIIAIQCKRWSSPVGETVIRDFFGSMHHAEIKIGIVIATTTFSSQAKAFVKNKPIKLIDLDNLVHLVH